MRLLVQRQKTAVTADGNYVKHLGRVPQKRLVSGADVQIFGNRWRRRVRVSWLARQMSGIVALALRNNRRLSRNDTGRPSWFEKEGADLSPLPRHQCVVFLCVFVALAGATAHGKSDTALAAGGKAASVMQRSSPSRSLFEVLAWMCWRQHGSIHTTSLHREAPV